MRMGGGLVITMDSTATSKAGVTNAGFGVCGLWVRLSEVNVRIGECSAYVSRILSDVFYS